MNTVISKDGTTIVCETMGMGQPLVLVDGALCYRGNGTSRSLAAELSRHFTVTLYDRRGRGDSSNIFPYAVEREVEDLEAVINAIGQPVYMFGQSSGAVLAAAAAKRLGEKVMKLGLYEAPLIVDSTRLPITDDDRAKMEKLVAADDRSAAVKMFLNLVGAPRLFIALMPLLPVWPRTKGVAHTLPYDFAITGPYQSGKPLSAEDWKGISMPTFVGVGGKSPSWMKNGQRSLAQAIPNAQLFELPGQTHMLSSKAITPMLTKYFIN